MGYRPIMHLIHLYTIIDEATNRNFNVTLEFYGTKNIKCDVWVHTGIVEYGHGVSHEIGWYKFNTDVYNIDGLIEWLKWLLVRLPMRR